jgi:hypothetical protein
MLQRTGSKGLVEQLQQSSALENTVTGIGRLECRNFVSRQGRGYRNLCATQQTRRYRLSGNGHEEARVFIDTDLLRMGAAFSDSAGTLVQRGAHEFGAAQPRAGIFGDFTVAEQFHQSLSQTQALHVRNMQKHYTVLTELAGKANGAAAIFRSQDTESAATIDASAHPIDM